METTEIKYRDVILIPVENILKVHRDGYNVFKELERIKKPLLDKTVREKQKAIQENHSLEVKAIKTNDNFSEEDKEFLLENQSTILKLEMEEVVNDFINDFDNRKDLFVDLAKAVVSNFSEIEKYINADDFDLQEFKQPVQECYFFLIGKSREKISKLTSST